MDQVVTAAGTALVSAMATDAWQQVHSALVALWRRVHPETADSMATELQATRVQVVAARRSGNEDLARTLSGTWSVHLQQLLDEDPTLLAELQLAIIGHMTAVPTPGTQAEVRSVSQKATARSSSKIIQVGGNATIN
jgi:hypothetical protein